jgi:hypothetical protein
MSLSILDKLKIKPIPQVKQTIEIGIQKPQTQEAVYVATPIIDKSSSQFDRSLFLQKINSSKESQLPPTGTDSINIPIIPVKPIIKPAIPVDASKKKKSESKTKKAIVISQEDKDTSSSSKVIEIDLDTTLKEKEKEKEKEKKRRKINPGSR